MDKIIDLKGLNGLYLFADKFQDNDLFTELTKFKYINCKYLPNNTIIGSNEIRKSNSNELKSEISINNEIISGKKYDISFDLKININGTKLIINGDPPITVSFYVNLGSNKVPLDVTTTGSTANYSISGNTIKLTGSTPFNIIKYINLNGENIRAGKTKDFKIIMEYSKLSGDNDIKYNFILDPKTIIINTYGISVYTDNKSSSNKFNGKFNILNRSKEFVYYNSITYKSISLRNNYFYSKKDISVNILPSNMDKDDDSFDYNYEIIFKNNKIGDLKILVPPKYINGNNTKMYPFEYLTMFATYSVYHPANRTLVSYLSKQYYGQSNLNPNIKKGYIDVNFEIKFYTDSLFTNFITDTFTITLPLINDKDYSGTNEEPPIINPKDFDFDINNGTINSDISVGFDDTKPLN